MTLPRGKFCGHESIMLEERKRNHNLLSPVRARGCARARTMALEIGVNFKIFDESLFDLVFEMMPFQSDVFRLHFGAFTIGQHNIFKI
jgi:hypothetical protein